MDMYPDPSGLQIQLGDATLKLTNNHKIKIIKDKQKSSKLQDIPIKYL